MKIPTNLIETIPVALVEIFQQKKTADRVVDFNLKNHSKWGSRDRRFFAENVYTIVRNYRKLWIQSGLDPKDYLNTEKINLSSMKKISQFHLDANLETAHDVEEPVRFAEKESFTDWFDDLGRKELGDDWESIAHALNQQAPVFLRANLLKTTQQKLKNILDQEQVPCRIRPENETAIELTARKNVFITKSFQQGLFEVQDFSSQQVAPLLNPKPGETVVDGCAGAGGKTLHLAALMKNKGKIHALDIHQRKLDELEKRAERAGSGIIYSQVIQSPEVIKKLKECADAVVLDVPCSGSGVIRRNPDTKWKFQAADFDQLLTLQQDILQNYSQMVKKGGRLVYSTCSVFPSENIKQVMNFLENNPDYTLVSSRLFRPDIDPGDGFFMALLHRSK